jgi:hypothetical protein
MGPVKRVEKEMIVEVQDSAGEMRPQRILYCGKEKGTRLLSS